MGEIAFQVHYQYLLSQIRLNENRTKESLKASKSTTSLSIDNLELHKQRRELEELYPDFYKNFKYTLDCRLDYRGSTKKK